MVGLVEDRWSYLGWLVLWMTGLDLDGWSRPVWLVLSWVVGLILGGCFHCGWSDEAPIAHRVCQRLRAQGWRTGLSKLRAHRVEQDTGAQGWRTGVSKPLAHRGEQPCAQPCARSGF